MVLKATLLLSLFFTSLTASAQARQSVLWEVSGNGLKYKSYLFGTVHTLSPSILDKFPVKQYIDRAQFGVFEVLGTSIASAQPKKNSAPERPQPPLDSLFSKQDYAVVDSFFSASPLGGIKAHNTEADLHSMLYAVKMLKQTPGTDPKGLDDSIYEEIKRTGKPTFSLDADDDPNRRGFETRYSQLASLIVALIKEKDNQLSNALTGGIEEEYVANLLTDLKLNKEAIGGIKEMTVRRNLLWYPQLAQKMQEGSCFIVVGLGHLQYKSGLIKLLHQHGYKVRPVKLPHTK